jgi:hypothetical protein
VAVDATLAAPSAVLDSVRPAVRSVLERSESFRALPPDQQRQLALDMVKVGVALASPAGAGPLSAAQANAADQVRAGLARDPGFAGEDFVGGAVATGTQQFGQLVQTVDFPTFVASLISGTFDAIVDSSIRQMRAYGELLGNVSKSVDQFARDNITPNNARDWLIDQFPDVLELHEEGVDGGFAEDGPTSEEQTVTQARIATREDAPDDGMARIKEALQVARDLNLDSPESEAELVRQAQLQIARGRQQLLASMVVLGINRIVVTDGLINAKVLFDMKARDVATRGRTASMHDRSAEKSKLATRVGYGSWFSPVSASASAEHQTEHVATVSSAIDEQSESRAELKARLSGEVRVNFKSDHFPLDKLATPQMLSTIQGNAVPPENRIEGA